MSLNQRINKKQGFRPEGQSTWSTSKEEQITFSFPSLGVVCSNDHYPIVIELKALFLHNLRQNKRLPSIK